ncbi:PDZ domain-containing protein [Streptomyces sp. FH025]|uniref:M61 family metallopeptidase n=1 Tax=Streptomyces sp. FH025 TaxID=2815937 RepID=UPI001A9FD6CF|nr:PDZ domain-containing protein [Streptomyces sp. FH025]MBO1419032.1 PDZ domain-containing protein [Streptomyces sp. FH025]
MTITEPVHYQVTVDPHLHQIRVVMTIKGMNDGTGPTVETPTWVPGDYTFAPYGRDIFEVKATDLDDGHDLTVRRDGWQGYHIEQPGPNVRITYTASCESAAFGEASGILDDGNGVLLGTRYLRVTSYDGPYRVTYDLPKGWALHHPSGATPVGATTWEYPGYEILLDTPVVVGSFDHKTRQVAKTPFHHVFLDRAAGFETRADDFVDQVGRVADGYRSMFGSFPFEDYTFVYGSDPTEEWGLEHLTSTMVGIDPNVFTDPVKWATGIRVCAHELFHAWNVRRLRPAPLGELDLRGGSFTEGLWVAEGFTRYYEFLSCTRAEAYTPEQFLSAVVNYYRHLVALPAYQRVSPVDASLASFLNHGDKYAGKVNDATDYYDQGMVIAFCLDATLRLKARTTLDQVFADFYGKHAGKGSGYTLDDLRKHLESVLAGLGERVLNEAGKPARLALVPRLEELGFTVGQESVKSLGLVLKDDTGPVVYGVLDTGPAGAAGLAPDDVITTVDAKPFDLTALRWLRDNSAGVTLGVLRGNRPRTYTVRPASRQQIGSLTWNGTSAQAAAIGSWLGRPFAPEAGQDIPLDFYENFHGVQTVI